MHHSSSYDEEIQKIVSAESLGATGKFPEGKLTDQDEGEIKYSIGTVDGKIVVSFGKSVTWVGMDIAQAREFALMLRQRANDIEKKKGVLIPPGK